MQHGIRRKSIRDPKTNVEKSEFRELKQELDQLMVEMTEEPIISVRLDYETSGSNMDSGSIVFNTSK